MSVYRFRYLRTMYDKIVGIAVEKPSGRQFIEFNQGAPKLEMLHLYVEKIAEKPAFKALQIYDVSKIYTTRTFSSCQQLMDEGRNFLV
jgi:hypothetical protein